MATGTVEARGRVVEFIWRIPQFAAVNTNVGKYINSPEFRGVAGEKWDLDCFPMGRDEHSRDFVYLCLFNKSREVKASYKMALVKRGGGVKEIGSGEDQVFSAGHPRGSDRDLSRDEALNNTIDGELVFQVKIMTGRSGPIDPPSTLTSDLANLHLSETRPSTLTSDLANLHLSEPPIVSETRPSSLNSDLANLLQRATYSDLTIQVDGEELKVHKNILAGRSDYFDRLLESGMEDANQGRITITDFSKETVQAMLAYLYHERLPDGQVAEELVLAADKYQLIPLKQICATLLMSNIKITNVCNILQISDSLKLPKVKEAACNFICSNWKHVIPSEDFQCLFINNNKLATEVLLRGNCGQDK